MATFKTFSIRLWRDLEGKKIPIIQNKTLCELMKKLYIFCRMAKNRLIMFVNGFCTFQKILEVAAFFVAYDDFVESLATV